MVVIGVLVYMGANLYKPRLGQLSNLYHFIYGFGAGWRDVVFDDANVVG